MIADDADPQPAAPPRRYFRLFLSIGLLGLFYPLLELSPHGVGGYAWTAVFWLVLFQSSCCLRSMGHLRRVAQVFALFAFALGLLALPFDPATDSFGLGLNIAARVAGATLLGLTTVFVLGDVVGPHRIDVDQIWGAACVYVLMGLTWAHVYCVACLLSPDALQPAPAPNESLSASIYFSFGTLTTIGYGDIVPGHAVTRLLGPVEAIGGQLYLTILVARLVGLHISGSRP